MRMNETQRPRQKLIRSSNDLRALLLKYSRQGRAEEIRALINEYGEDVRQCVNTKDQSKLSPLHYAARNGQLECVRLLVELAGADINVKNDEKTTPLHFAARYRRATDKPVSEFLGSTPSHRPNSSNHHTGFYPKRDRSIPLYLDNVLLEDVVSDVWEPTDVPSEQLLINRMASSPVRARPPTSICDPVVHYLVVHGAELNGQDANGWTALHYAAIRGNEVATRQLVQEPGIDIELEDHDLMRPIHMASLHKEVEITRQLLMVNADPLAMTQSGCTPLHFACATGDLELVQLILDAIMIRFKSTSSPFNITNRDGESPLHWAVANGYAEVARFCIEHGADANLTPKSEETCLHMAARVGSVSTTKLLLSFGVHIDAEDLLLQTALHKAAERNNSEVMKLLLQNGSDLENQDHDAYTPLLLAAARGQLEVTQLLIDAGANIAAQEKMAKGLIYLCAEADEVEVLRLILQHPKAKQLIDVPNIYDDTPLHVAAKNGHLDIVKLLLENGANVSSKNEKERTAFHNAAKYGRLNIARHLLEHAPSLVSERDEDGSSAIHLAAASGHVDLLELLLDAGAAVDCRNCMQWTPLDCAAASGHRACVELLLENNSPIDPVDVNHTTPLYLACKHGHEDVVQLLLEWGADPGIRKLIDETMPDCGPNALDIAIANGNKSCAYALLQSSMWKNALRNQTIGPDGIIQTPMRKLITHMPDLAEYVMDRCIANETGRNVELHNFEFLEDTYAHWCKQAILREHDLGLGTSPVDFVSEKLIQARNLSFPVQNGTSPMKLKNRASLDDIIPIEQNRPYTKDSSVLKTNHPLMLMVKYNRPRLLEHRLVRSLMNQKWTRTSLVYHANLLIYLLYLIFYSVYMLNTQSLNALVYTDSLNTSHLSPQQVCRRLVAQGSLATTTRTLLTAKYAVLFFALFNLGKELFQLLFNGYRYLTLENLMECCIFTLAILTVVDADDCMRRMGLKQSWQWQCGAVGIFLAWLNLLLFLRRIPTLGIFVLMFTVVMRTFTKFFIVFFLFIFAFAFGFHILLFNHVPFNSLGNSFLKTTVMMLGELEFDATFNEQFSSTERSDVIFFGSITYALFVTFLIVMTIVIMNLLVGLAVDDIKGVQNQAAVRRLAMQIQLMLDIESVLPHWLRKRFNPTSVTLVHGKHIHCTSLPLSRLLSCIGQCLTDELGELQGAVSEQEESRTINTLLETFNDRITQLQSNQDTILVILNRLTNAMEREKVEEPLIAASSQPLNESIRMPRTRRRVTSPRQRSNSIERLR
uniref:Transient receptor potential cation channel 3 n=1 Tax=Cryptocotyle lingua TaxID=66766 RepID=A0A7U0TIW6_9TREM|nr:transient receptor potential cation channel 3 [Cryptocotyle lingua]